MVNVSDRKIAYRFLQLAAGWIYFSGKFIIFRGVILCNIFWFEYCQQPAAKSAML